MKLDWGIVSVPLTTDGKIDTFKFYHYLKKNGATKKELEDREKSLIYLLEKVEENHNGLYNISDLIIKMGFGSPVFRNQDYLVMEIMKELGGILLVLEIW